MKKFRIFWVCLFIIASAFWLNEAEGQCSMCKAVAESSQDENNIKTGLNSGILYLLATPYILIGGLAVFFFRKQVGEKIKSLKK